MEKFIYQGAAPCHLTLSIEDKVTEVSLYPGGIYDLPNDNAKVKRYVLAEILKPVYIKPNKSK